VEERATTHHIPISAYVKLGCPATVAGDVRLGAVVRKDAELGPLVLVHGDVHQLNGWPPARGSISPPLISVLRRAGPDQPWKIAVLMA
jgi:hypothetical protein